MSVMRTLVLGLHAPSNTTVALLLRAIRASTNEVVIAARSTPGRSSERYHGATGVERRATRCTVRSAMPSSPT